MKEEEKAGNTEDIIKPVTTVDHWNSIHWKIPGDYVKLPSESSALIPRGEKAGVFIS